MEICDRVSSISHVVDRFPKNAPIHRTRPSRRSKRASPAQSWNPELWPPHVPARRPQRPEEEAWDRVGIVRLQEANVEDGMDFQGGRQLQAIRRSSDLANHTEWIQATDILLR